MAEAIPFDPSVPHQRVEATMAGIAIVIDARWNARDSAFYLDFFEADGLTPIIRSVKVVLGAKLGRTSTHPFFVGKALFAFDRSGEGVECGLDDLGARVDVMYLTERDVQIAQSTPRVNQSDVDPV